MHYSLVKLRSDAREAKRPCHPRLCVLNVLLVAGGWTWQADHWKKTMGRDRTTDPRHGRAYRISALAFVLLDALRDDDRQPRAR